MAERGKIGTATSPSASTVAPSASTTATAPPWRLSTRLPRVTSTRGGLGLGGGVCVRGDPGGPPFLLKNLCPARGPRFRRKQGEFPTISPPFSTPGPPASRRFD